MPLKLPLSLLAGVLLAVLALAAPASASQSTVRVGIANQTPAMFTSERFQDLDVQRTRYFIRWNAIDEPAQLQAADAFVAAARADDVDVLLHISTDDFTPGQARLPSRREFRSKVGRLVDRYYDEGVREWGVWNEANDRTQPTYRSPTRAADFFVDMWGMLNDADKCGSSVFGKCRIVALDLLDGFNADLRGNARSYARRFYARLSPTYDRRARIVGIHNYSDTNRGTSTGTRNIIDEVTDRGPSNVKFWLTETGGVVRLGDSYRCNASSSSSVRSAERRASRATAQMFRLALDFRRDVDRLYVYQWSGSDCDPAERFDAGLVRRDGSARPGLTYLERKLRDSSILKP